MITARIVSVIILILTVVFSVCVSGVFLAFPVMLCWNYAVSPIFDLRNINFWQAYCLIVLSAILIKSTLSAVRDSN